MKYVKEFECTLCGQKFDDFHLLTCPQCGEKGILEINYDYDEMKKEVNKTYFQNNKEYSMLRYLPMMSIKSKPKDSLSVGWTPLYKSKNIGNIMGVKNLFFKDEGLNPTASLKDRASLVACIKAKEHERDVICCSSTGNAASSLAGNAAKLGLTSVILVPERAPRGKIAQLQVYGANVIKIKGNYKDTFEASKNVINQYGFYNRNAAINPHLVEGKKTVALEISEQLAFKDIDNVFVSVGDGCTIYGVYKGFYDLYRLGITSKIPRVIGVQSEGCCPFYTAWKESTNLKETEENTIADSIAVGIPRNPIKGLKAVHKSHGFFVTVKDSEIIDAISTLGSNEGIFAEPAAAASFAGFEKAIREQLISKSEVSVVIITGNGLKDIDSVIDNVSSIKGMTKQELDLKISKDISESSKLDDFLNIIES